MLFSKQTNDAGRERDRFYHRKTHTGRHREPGTLKEKQTTRKREWEGRVRRGDRDRQKEMNTVTNKEITNKEIKPRNEKR